jgi:cysteine desulfurase
MDWDELPVANLKEDDQVRVEKTIYMDYQASTPMDQRVLDAMLPYFTHSFGNPHSSDHILGWKAGAAVDAARSAVASLIGANSEEILFTSGATESNNHALRGIAKGNRTTRNRMLVGATEHKCVTATAEALSDELGLIVQFIPVTSEGRIDQESYRKLLGEDVLFVSIMAVNNEIGTFQDIKTLASMAHKWGALFHCDAAQAPAVMELDVFDLNIDVLSLSAHKMYGPKGIGALFVGTDLLPQFPPMIHGGEQQGGLRPGTLPTPLCVGFGKAAELIKNDKDGRTHLLKLKKQFLQGLTEAGVEYQQNSAPLDYCHPGNINLRFEGVDAHSLLTMLQPLLCASTGSACNSGTIESSYVLRTLGLSREQMSSSIRFSLGRYSDDSQVDEAVQLLASKIGALRN